MTISRLMRHFIPGILIATLFACAGAGIRAPHRTMTQPAITPADVRARVYLIADDSMQGREAGEPGNVAVTSYIAAELARMGLQPAGENGTWFQTIPMIRRLVDPASSLRVANESFNLFADFAPIRPTSSLRSGTRLVVDAVPVIYAGRAGDSATALSADQVAGRIVVLGPPLDTAGRPASAYARPAGLAVRQFPSAAGIAIASLGFITPASETSIRSRGVGLARTTESAPLAVLISTQTAEKLMGAPLESLRPGSLGRPVHARMGFRDEPAPVPARNVVAILWGSDPRLRGQYVAIGAHNDHIGIESRAVDHDSLRAFNRVMRPEGRQTTSRTPAPEQRARIRVILDSLRMLAPPRVDSINNGADDDGSGTVAALEIAESLVAARRPRRSILFVWHTAEEGGLLGSSWFTDHPTVSRDSIVAQLNMDMVGRGPDSARRDPRTVQIIGSRRLSTQLGDVVEMVNASRPTPFRIDHSYDAPGHPLNRYCRSDHYNYARYGIPITYFSRGYHDAYHMVTDEAQYLDYEGLAQVAGLVRDVAVAIADREERLVVDKPKMDPLAPCQQ